MSQSLNSLLADLDAEQIQSETEAAACHDVAMAAVVIHLNQFIAAHSLDAILGLAAAGRQESKAVARGATTLGDMRVDATLSHYFRSNDLCLALAADNVSTDIWLSLHLVPEAVRARVGAAAQTLRRLWQEEQANAAHRAARAQAEEAARERGRRGLALYARLQADFASIQDSYHSAARAWAESETARLWRPWSCWQVRYVPIGHAVRDDDGEPVIAQLAVLDDIDMVIHQSPGAGVQVISPLNGSLSDRILGAFLDAAPIDFLAPVLHEPLAYHRTVHAGCSYLNIPPTAGEQPAPPPQQPIPWSDYLAQRLGDADLAGDFLARCYYDEPDADWLCIQKLADLTLG